jgi:hypothetical protein
MVSKHRRQSYIKAVVKPENIPILFNDFLGVKTAGA